MKRALIFLFLWRLKRARAQGVEGTTCMKIALDISSAGLQPTGIGRYSRLLVEQYLKLFPEHHYVLYRVVGWRELLRRPFLPNSSTHLEIRTAYPSGRFVQKLRPVFPIDELYLSDVDVYHGKAPDVPSFRRAKKIVLTVHDLGPLVHPELFPRAMVKRWSTFVRSSKRISRWIADSEHTRKEMEMVLGLSPEQVRVIPLGVPPEFLTPVNASSLQRVENRFGLEGEYILAVGTLQPRKNLLRLIQAFSLLRSQKQFEGKLVVAGGGGWLAGPIFEARDRSPYANDILFLGYVEDRFLPPLYRKASALAFVSVYEGFGFPILEAFASGVPVVASNVSPHSEVAADAAFYVDPHNVESIAQGLSHVLNQPEEKQRLVEKGYRQIDRFNWEATARATFLAYLE